uniref:Transposase n=1 Tax=Streptococcus suis TaxID=1307 RepID=G8DU82_STRSU|nr:transposase [Streptococcus suis]
MVSYLRLYSIAVPNLEAGKTACSRHQSKNSSIKGVNSVCRLCSRSSVDRSAQSLSKANRRSQ